MRVTICWTGISGYMAACWRALSRQMGVELKVVAYQPPSGSFDPALLGDLQHHLLGPEERASADRIAGTVAETKPQALVIAGWANPAYVQLARTIATGNLPIVMTMDTPYRGQLRQRIARYRLSGFLKHIDRVVVAGERAWQYARRLGFSEAQIHRGVYGYDDQLFDPIGESRTEWPRRFLYVGRYVQQKGLDTMVEAYRAYRSAVTDPWPLTTCGGGALKHLVTDVDGIEDRGFTQPTDLPATLAEHGVFVLPSHYEPWGVVIAESAAAGMPLICSEQVGASVEIVRDFANGRMVPTANAPALADAFHWMHENARRLPTMGRQARASAAPHSATLWGIRWAEMLKQITREA